MKAMNFAAALNQRHHRFLGRRSLKRAVLGFAASEALIRLYELPFAAEHGRDLPLAHCLADAHGHEPCSFQSDAENAMKLIAAHPLLAGA